MPIVDDTYHHALRQAHESMADMVLVTGMALDNHDRAARLRGTLGVQLHQLVATLHEALQVITRE
jgi:hypothetical protein